jgi:hypothetical protein
MTFSLENPLADENTADKGLEKGNVTSIVMVVDVMRISEMPGMDFSLRDGLAESKENTGVS